MTITYTVQLRHVPSHFYGTKVTPGKGGTTYAFDELHNLMTVSHFDTVDDALLEVCLDKKHTTNPTNYFTIRPYTEAVAAKVNRYEVWITIPCKNGLRTYVLSGHNSFVPIMDHDSDLQPLHFSCEQNAQKYADSLELTNYRVMQLSNEF